VLVQHGVRACSDVTGYSFTGHAMELADKGHLDLRIRAADLPYLDGTAALAAVGQLPGGARCNRSWYELRISFDPDLPESFRALFFVPETSGGLLAAIPPEQVRACLAALRSADITATIVGECLRAKHGPGHTRRQRYALVQSVTATGKPTTGLRSVQLGRPRRLAIY
jgi:selenide,water dikinase